MPCSMKLVLEAAANEDTSTALHCSAAAAKLSRPSGPLVSSLSEMPRVESLLTPKNGCGCDSQVSLSTESLSSDPIPE